MAKDRTLTAQRRAGDGKGEARKLRQNGQIPAVIYGGGSDPVAIALDSHLFQGHDKVFKKPLRIKIYPLSAYWRDST
jgi:ribosomal protein L25 (general stress protein Ctc)